MRKPTVTARVLFATFLWFAVPPSVVSAQLRLQETPSLYGLGHIFRDVQVRFDTGIGTTSTTTSLGADDIYPAPGTAWFWGVYVDKPILSTLLDIGYDFVWWHQDRFPRDTLGRELIDTIRFVAHYRQGEFFVSGDRRRDEFYVGGRVVFDLGRIARHFSSFQR